MEIKRRRLLTEPGETLLLSDSSINAAYRFSEWQEYTGLDPARFTTSTLCSVPIPVYGIAEPGKRQFAEVRPEAMWHPLFWLPERLAGLYSLPGIDGEEGAVETNEMRSIRVALEMAGSGLYNERDGWLDVLGTVGLDVEDDFDLARIEEWQAGAPDELLDSIDLDLYLKLDDEDWALKAAMVLIEPLQRCDWALLSDSLITILDDAASPANETADLASVRTATGVVASLAVVQLASVPDLNGRSSVDFWSRVERAARQGTFTDLASFLSGPVAAGLHWLYTVRDLYWPALQELNELQQA